MSIKIRKIKAKQAKRANKGKQGKIVTDMDFAMEATHLISKTLDKALRVTEMSGVPNLTVFYQVSYETENGLATVSRVLGDDLVAGIAFGALANNGVNAELLKGLSLAEQKMQTAEIVK